MKPVIKNFGKLKQKSALATMCIVIMLLAVSFSSCKKDDTISIIIDMTGEPDKIIENISGTLYYEEHLKMWEVSYHIPETHDSVDMYLIAEMPNGKFTFEAGKKVSVSGLCYEIPHKICFDKGLSYFYPAGVRFFYIKVTDLKYEN